MKTYRRSGDAKARSALAATVALLWPAAAWASAQFEFRRDGYYIIDFVVFVGLLVWLLRKPLARYLQERRDIAIREMREAQEVRLQAERELENYRRRLAALDAERARIVEEFREAALRDKARILADTQQQLRKLEADSKLRLEREAARLREALRREGVNASIAVAEKLLAARLDRQAQQALVDASIQRLSGAQLAGALRDAPEDAHGEGIA